MKITVSFIAIFLFVVTSYAQSKTISKDEYDTAFRFAVTETNADYPVILKVRTTYLENGKTVGTVTDITENEAPGVSRNKKTEVEDGKETNQYQINAGYGKVFCSEDGVSWKPSQYECVSIRMIRGRRDTVSIEYSFTEKIVKGKKVKIYREYSVFSSSERNNKKEFQEKISTIDSRGFFITVVDTEGTLNPRTVSIKREQSWVTKAKIKPIVAPK